MSNHVSEIYSSVIETVLREARAEFEESGDDPYILQTLKTTWKKRLMEMNISKGPLWVDLAPENNTNDASSSVQHSTNINANADGYSNGAASGPENILYNLQNKSANIDPLGNLNSITTQSTVLESLGSHQSFDILAANSQMANGISGGNISGASTSNNGNDNINNVNSNNSSQKTTNMAYNPLSNVKTTVKDENGGQINLSPELHAQLQNAMNKGDGKYGQIPQTDGLDDELNSDLDDSEDELNSNDEEEDSDQTQLMLCLYEKVHKVKTRWKYTLKDGVANVNGLDYVFNKATGESEW